MSKYKFTKPCDISKLAREIQAATGMKLMADDENDTVDGFITRCGDDVDIVFYDNDEAPTAVHKTTFRKKQLSAAEQTQLGQLISAHVK